MVSASLDLDIPGLPLEGLGVLRVDGEETLSRPFRFEVLASSGDAALDPLRLLGVEATLTLRQGDAERTVRGRVGAVEQGDRTSDGGALVRATIVPGDALSTAEPPAQPVVLC